MVKAKVIQFRMGRHTMTPRHFLIEIEGCTSKDKTSKFIGKHVEWHAPGKLKKVLKGTIMSSHGNKGVVRAIFEKGLPGQAMGTDVKIVGDKE